jgi:large subunit ribosomal protein L7A
LISKLKTEPMVVGIKQSRKAVTAGRAVCVFLAFDADPHITDPLEEICAQHQVPVDRSASMKELGSACGIAVGAAVAALVK